MPKTTKNNARSVEEKGLLDWILGSLQKDDQLLETDPILNKVEGSGRVAGYRKSTTPISVPNKKSGVFSSLFAKD